MQGVGPGPLAAAALSAAGDPQASYFAKNHIYLYIYIYIYIYIYYYIYTTNYYDKVTMDSMIFPETDSSDYFTIAEAQSSYYNKTYINAHSPRQHSPRQESRTFCSIVLRGLLEPIGGLLEQ